MGNVKDNQLKILQEKILTRNNSEIKITNENKLDMTLKDEDKDLMNLIGNALK